MKFEDKVAIITGASRGVGRALALGLANQGCDVVVAAKSVEESESLPGTIHTVAKEVKALGRRALPFQVDVRDGERIEAMVDEAVKQFGRVDFLLNNAGALYWKNVVDTPTKRYDLVNAVNARASFIAARACVPHMKAQGFGHIINMSPPIVPEAAEGKVAYMISKFGMTLLTIGLGGELQGDPVAVNSLWPVTMIESYATINWGLGGPAHWRKADILVDAVLEIFSRDPKTFSGQALLDEPFLREECGVTDFTKYRCDPDKEPPQVGLKWGIQAGK